MQARHANLDFFSNLHENILICDLRLPMPHVSLSQKKGARPEQNAMQILLHFPVC